MSKPLWRVRAIALGLIALMVISIECAQSALIPPMYVDSVVALGSMQPVPQSGQPPRVEWKTVGTGFFYGYLITNDPEPAKRIYQTYLVTARHVVLQHLQAFGDLHVRVNPKDPASEGRGFEIATTPGKAKPGNTAWAFHPDASIDIAVILVSIPFLRAQGIAPGFFRSDEDAANRAKLKEMEVSAGDGVFVLGFPMNLAGVQRNHVIARQGVVARVSEMLHGASRTFMIDSLVFPGNSGGPVILKPEIAAIQGTKSHLSAALLGLVTGYHTYIDTAVSPQTGHPRVTFEENSGLAEVLPVDFIEETINAWRATQADLPETKGK
jgi:S1-C subfamily serine protease